MPTYEYRCPNGHGFEEFFLKISAAKSELPCPTCGELGARHLSAGGGLVFKGSGFYITDYGKDGKKSQAPAATGKAESSGAAGADGGSSSASTSDASASAGAKSDAAKADAPKPSAAKPDGGARAPGAKAPKSPGE